MVIIEMMYKLSLGEVVRPSSWNEIVLLIQYNDCFADSLLLAYHSSDYRSGRY